jgi:hypothetical protein
MNRTFRILTLVLTAACVIIATGCPAHKSIAEINRNPGKYNGKGVTVVGRVKTAYGASIPGSKVGAGIYEVDDGTGTIWVVADAKGVPAKGTEVAVSGTVGNGVNWGGRNYGLGIHEQHRHYQKR